MRLDQLFPALRDLGPDTVQAYLRSRGWVPVPDPRDIVAVYASPRGDEVVVPLERSLGDRARVLGDLVSTLSEVEARSPLEILEELSLPPGDLLTFRVRSDLVTSGTIPLLDALRLREGAKNLLLAAAHSALVPQRYFPRMARQEPTELLAACREGQTERGSYLTKLIVPVEPAVGPLTLEEPYARRVTRLLLETLDAVRQRLVRADDEGLLREPPPGLSYNLLTALAEMRPPGEQSLLDISVRWSRSRPVPPTPAGATFASPQFVTMRSVAGALREQAPAPCEIEGYVTRLSRPGVETGAPGEVVVLTTLGERPAEARVRLELPAETYREQAIPAHRDGRRVRVAGVLQRAGRSWQLGQPSGFEMLPGEEE